jgi:hypothetical protein
LHSSFISMHQYGNQQKDMIMLKYRDAVAIVKVVRPGVVSDECDETHIITDVCEFKTWQIDVINKILDASMVGESVKPGDHVSISIEIKKDATWEDNTATETK